MFSSHEEFSFTHHVSNFAGAGQIISEFVSRR